MHTRTPITNSSTQYTAYDTLSEILVTLIQEQHKGGTYAQLRLEGYQLLDPLFLFGSMPQASVLKVTVGQSIVR